MKKLLFMLEPVAIPFLLVTFVSCVVYATVQQSYRSGANDPQIQIAHDSVTDLENGIPPSQVVSSKKIDISKSLAPYIIVFNNSRIVVASSAILNSKTPIPPTGVFDFVKENSEERFSWEPQPGVRSAAVMMHYNGSQSGFILVGRSLREVELREERLSYIVGLAWALALTSITAIAVLFKVVKRH